MHKFWMFMCVSAFFVLCDEPKSELTQDLGDRTQSQNVPFGTSGDVYFRPFYKRLHDMYIFSRK